MCNRVITGVAYFVQASVIKHEIVALGPRPIRTSRAPTGKYHYDATATWILSMYKNTVLQKNHIVNTLEVLSSSSLH